jgi:hypothetical protein
VLGHPVELGRRALVQVAQRRVRRDERVAGRRRPGAEGFDTACTRPISSTTCRARLAIGSGSAARSSSSGVAAARCGSDGSSSRSRASAWSHSARRVLNAEPRSDRGTGGVDDEHRVVHRQLLVPRRVAPHVERVPRLAQRRTRTGP